MGYYAVTQHVLMCDTKGCDHAYRSTRMEKIEFMKECLRNGFTEKSQKYYCIRCSVA